MTRKPSVEYWENYYQKGVAPEVPSLFAQHVLGNFAKPGDKLIELGCGNGRDARFFATNGIGVVAIDQCAGEIDTLGSEVALPNLSFQAEDFTRLPAEVEKYDLIYSRFTFHSVTAEAQERTLEWCHNNLVDGGKLCVETRGQKNEIYGKGVPVTGEEDAYIYEDHYRRFVDFDKFTADIKAAGFKILESAEDTGFAPFEDTDYHFIRTIAEK